LPGHSVCGLFIYTNDEFLHVVDEVMFSPDGVPMFPSSDGNDFKGQLESLNKLRNYRDFTFITPAYGSVFSGENLEEEIMICKTLVSI